jgi:hypothetical protein
MSAHTQKPIDVAFEVSHREALALAQFLKRVGFREIRVNAQDEDEAYEMRNSLAIVRQALADVGYAPR